jgi:hypothetical protein
MRSVGLIRHSYIKDRGEVHNQHCATMMDGEDIRGFQMEKHPMKMKEMKGNNSPFLQYLQG